MKLDIYNDTTAFEILRTGWNSLVSVSKSKLLFLTIEWQETWWEAYHPGELHIIAGTDAQGNLVGIAPWFIHKVDDERVIRTIGCVDVTDYLDVLVAQDHEESFLSALAEHLAAASAEYDRVSFCNIPAQAEILRAWPPMLESKGFIVNVDKQEVCPVITLPETWDDYLSQLNKKQRHELRRKIRRAGQQVDWYMVGPEHNLAEELEAFMRLMAASADYKAEFLQDPQNTAFFRALAPRMMAAGWLQLSFLTVEGERAAAYLNFEWQDSILVYNSGQDIERFGSMSAGVVLLAALIRHAIETGHKTFDMLRGDENYKYQMGAVDTEIFRLTAKRAFAG